ncbi:MAG TPA: tetratricopeptide repeat protein [Abditibacteriaceae bacterium]|jgi:predicted ATPase/DNA-binding SARP family transcriptional activator
MNDHDQWRIHLFGGLRIQNGSTIVPRFRTQKAASLFAYLSYYRNRTHTREGLLEVLWPGCEIEAGRNRLRVVLSEVRAALGTFQKPDQPILITDRLTVAINPLIPPTDVVEFEAGLRLAAVASGAERIQHLSQAIELYTGPLLPGMYEDWVAIEGHRLEEGFLHALREIIHHFQQIGNIPGAIECALRGVSVDPLREEIHRDLMQLYASSGQATAALRQYRELGRALRRHLSVAPSEVTVQLFQQIKDSLKKGTDATAAAVAPVPGIGARFSSSDPIAPEAVTYESEVVSVEPEVTESAYDPHLPLQWTQFFGREVELQQLQEVLVSGKRRLVVLTGVGGSGKTRLAIEVARYIGAHWKDAIWFVPLANIADSTSIAGEVLGQLQIAREATTTPEEQVIEALQPHSSLLILDNFEHLLPGGTVFIQTLLTRVPLLTILVTSRQELQVASEYLFPLPPLPIPEGGSEEVLQCASIQMLLDRVRSVRPRFSVTKQNMGRLADICCRLEGLPLALELTAARAKNLSILAILRHLEQRLTFLSERASTSGYQHTGLRAALEWSYGLLWPDLQRFLAQLWVFRGGWTAAAAQAVTQQPHAVHYLEQLRACSLISAHEVDGEARYNMLETVREFAGEHLVESEREATRRCHAEFYIALAEEFDETGYGPDQAQWLEHLDQDHDNLRAVLAWCKEMPDRVEAGLRLVNFLRMFWDIRGHWTEARRYYAGILAMQELGTPTSVRVRTLTQAAWMARQQADYEEARRLYKQGRVLAQAIGDTRGEVTILTHLAWVANLNGNSAKERALHEEALALAQSLNDRAITLNCQENLADTALTQQDYGTARTLFTQCLTEAEDQGGYALQTALAGLGRIAEAEGDLASARSFYEKRLELTVRMGIKEQIAGALTDMARVVKYLGDIEAARGLYEQRLALVQELGHKKLLPISLLDLAVVLHDLGDNEAALGLYEQSLALQQEVGAERLIPATLLCIGRLYLEQGDLISARSKAEQSLPLAQKWLEGSIGHVLHLLGRIMRAQGDYKAAQVVLEQGLAIRQESPEDDIRGRLLYELGVVALLQNNFVTAYTLFEDSTLAIQEIDNKKSLPALFEGFAALAAVQQQLLRATRLFGASQALRESMKVPLQAPDTDLWDPFIAMARNGLDEQEFTSAWDEGRALTVEQSLDYALHD